MAESRQYKKALNQLSATKVAKTTEPGYCQDGGGLCLQVTKTGSKSWVLRFMINRKSREMGLGGYPGVTLAKARQLAADYRQMVTDGIDPIEARKAVEAVGIPVKEAKSFDDCAKAYIDAHRPGWSNPKHANQWTNTLATYASPVFGSKPVGDIDTDMMMAVLTPIWASKTETATRVRSRVENVLDWATVRKYRSGDNPARWKGHLEQLLPKPAKLKDVQHHPALPYPLINKFIADLRGRDHVSSQALQFTILTAARAGEAVGALPTEFDLNAAVWTVPASRMKGGKEHRVALCAAALGIAKDRITLVTKDQPWLFPGQRKNDHLTTESLLELGQGMAFGHLTTHGFRSTFRDWAAECTEYPSEVVEKALAHAVKNKVEAAYRRGDMLERRVDLMRDWQAYCDRPLKD